jgi:hypothetical protein
MQSEEEMTLLTFPTQEAAMEHVARAWPVSVATNKGNYNILWQMGWRYVAEMWLGRDKGEWMVLCEQRETG